MTQSLPLVHLHRPALKPVAQGASPLLVLLHGYGSNEEDLFGLHSYLDDRLIIVSARAPITMGPGSYARYPLDWRPNGTIIPDETNLPATLNLIASFVAGARKLYDAGPVFLAGFSQGAMMSEALALTQPAAIAGAVLMSGRTLALLHANPPKSPQLPPFIVVHGTQDAVVPVAEGRATRDFLARLGARHDFHEYPMGHTINESSLDAIGVWLTREIDALLS